MQHVKKVLKQLVKKPNKYNLKYFNHKTWEILCVLMFFAAKNKKHYCFPSIATIKKMLKIRGLKISERSIFYHLALLEKKGYITRIRRIGVGPKGFIFKSTVYILNQKALSKFKGLIKFIRSTESVLGNLFSFKKVGFERFMQMLKRKSEVFRELIEPRQIRFMLELEDIFLETYQE